MAVDGTLPFSEARVANPFRSLFLVERLDWIIQLQYVNAEELIQLFRVAEPFGFKGSGF